MYPTVTIKHVNYPVTCVHARKLEGVADLLSSLHAAEEGGRDNTRDVLYVCVCERQRERER